MAYRFKVRKGNSALAEKDFYVGRIQNERIMSKREAYKYLVDEVGGKRADHAAAWKAIMEQILVNARIGNATRIDGLGVFRNSVKGGFQSAVGPWVRGVNMILVECRELTEFRNALEGAVPVNNTQGDKPTIKSILNTELEVYDIVRVGDVISIGGTNLAPDTEKDDEYVGIFKDDTLLAKATITKSELNTVECKFEGIALEAGEYRIGVFTRCGDSDESVSVKSTFRTVTVALAA